MIIWSKNLAYAIGLITADGYLSKDGRHITLVSKDIDQIQNFKKALKLKNKIANHSSTYNSNGKYYHVQFGNIELYRFLISIGLVQDKTKNIKSLEIPNIYFGNFLRGFFDGDGCTYSYKDMRWKNSFQFYTAFVSLSQKYLKWLEAKILINFGIRGSIRKQVLRSNRCMYRLEYAKKSSIKLMKNLYPTEEIIYLKRKKYKIDNALGIIEHVRRGGEIGRHARLRFLYP